MTSLNNNVVPAFWEPVPLSYCTARFSHSDLESIRQVAVSFIQEKQQRQHAVVNNQLYNYAQMLGSSSTTGNGGTCYNLSFDPFHLSSNELYGVVVGMFLSCSMHTQLDCNWVQLLSFVADCHSLYRSNPYHSFYHVVDVTFVVYYMLDSHGASRFLEPLDISILLLSALCHDLMHPGMNNLFQINACTDVAHLYHQQSVLESLSVSVAESLLLKHGLAIAGGDDRLVKGLRSCILSTDMAHHFKLMQEFNEMISTLTSRSFHNASHNYYNTGMVDDESVTIQIPLSSQKHRLTLMKILLHGADISNPCRPWELCKKWSDLVVTEFFQQGDLEKQLGLTVSPNMDRSHSNQIEISLGFGDVIVKPYFEMLASFVPEMHEFVALHDFNRLKWIELNNFTVAHAPPPSAIPSMTNLASVLSAKTSEQLMSNLSLEDSMRQLRTALIGRRVSVAAGVIQISEQMLSSLLSAKLGGGRSGRKISYEYVDASGSTSTNTVANSKSPSTWHSNANLTNPQVAQLKQQQQQQSNIDGRKNVSKTSLRMADFGSTTSFIPSPPSSSNITVASRRASLSGGGDDESPVRYNFARRRNSHTPALPPVESPARKKSYDSDSGVMDNILSTEAGTSKVVDSSTATSSEVSPPSPIMKSSEISPSSPVMNPVMTSPTEPEKIPPNRLFRPSYNLFKIAAALATTTIQRLLFSNRVEQRNINRRISAASAKISAISKILPHEPLDGSYRTIHRSDRIHEQILSRRRARPTVTLHDLAKMEELIQNHKLSPSSVEKKMPFIDPLLHAARTGEVQIIDNDRFDAFRRAFSEETIFQNINHGNI